MNVYIYMYIYTWSFPQIIFNTPQTRQSGEMYWNYSIWGTLCGVFSIRGMGVYVTWDVDLRYILDLYLTHKSDVEDIFIVIAAVVVVGSGSGRSGSGRGSCTW